MKKFMFIAFVLGFLLLPIAFITTNVVLLAISELFVIASGMWLFLYNLKNN
jgi:membrane protein implicated in regulation of membrane protease activity